jgi:DNA-directed RNA polymerase subunit K/omega
MEKPELDAMGNNKYQRVMLAARRARDLAEGIGLTPEMEGVKITTVAMGELNSGQLKNDMRPANESKA